MTREEAATEVVATCFWGDYDYTAQSLIEHLDADPDEFGLFLVGKVLDNSGNATNLLRDLLGANRAVELLSQVSTDDSTHGQRRRRRRFMVRTNLTGRLEGDPRAFGLRSWEQVEM